MQDNNIIIISDNNLVAEKFASKILLLRSIDSIGILSYQEALKNLDINNPDLIILHYEKNKDLEIISEILKDKPVNFAPLILLMETPDNDVICKAFDYGIEDFISEENGDAQILMKVIWAVKKKQLLNELNKKNNILVHLDVLDREMGFYTKQYTEKAFKLEFNEVIDKKINSIFMILSADICCKNILSTTFLASLIKKHIRVSDVAGFAPDNKFYVILNNTDDEGAKKIYTAINESFLDAYSISGAAIKIGESDFDVVERLLNKTLSEALIKKSSLLFVDENIGKKDISWADSSDFKEQNFKMFKETFMKKVNKIITPTFFQLQTVLEEKLFQAKIYQHVGEDESIFSIEKSDYKITIKVKYPGYSKISIDIIENYPDDKSTQRIILELYELTTAKLDEIMQNAISKFKEKTLNID